MTEIQRLDYSEPPPGYERRVLGSSVQAPLVSRPTPLAHATVPLRESIRRGADFEWFATEAEGRTDAWSRYKAHNDPPGIEVDGGAFYPQGYTGYLQCDGSDARADAWTWYDRRLVLAEKLDHVEAPDEARSVDEGASHMLTWSDDQVAEVERWLVDSTAELPEVLRG